MSKDKTPKEETLLRLLNVLQGQGMYIKDSTYTTKQEKLEQMDVILNVMRFLKDYDENIDLLDKYWRQKHHEQKFNITRKTPIQRFNDFLLSEEQRAETNSHNDTLEDRTLSMNITEDMKAIMVDYEKGNVNLLKFDFDKDKGER